MNISQNCKIKTLGAEFGWNYNDRSRRLDIAFGAKLDGEMGWLAWGLNPQGPHMVGTRALIGIKHKNDSLEFHQYNITDATRLGCQLLPIDDLGLDIRNFSFFYLEAIHYYMIKATVFLPLGYNSSRTNIVWQIGYAVADKEPKMHPTSLKNFDCAETIDLNSNQTITYKAHSRRNLRMAHGILNVMGWGIFLPVGVIIARYFRNFPKYWGLWYVFHTTCQIAAYILGSAGWVLGLWLGKQSKYYCYRTHGIFGIVIFTFTTIQMFALRLKPKRTDPYRDYWNMYHHFLGYALLTLISINIFKGIAILKPEDTWKWTYIGVLGFLGTTALAFEVYTWTKFVLERKSQNQKGGKNPPTDQNASKSKTAQPQGSAGTGTSVQPPTNLNL
ncbi:Cytochrome b561 and DOMON domain-containing protein [Abeliophyllum distichum]|uniref:Cytochrome b561 and DOMON domain-containing protein n=1 Tax=Abeliophyllum distichum TaxID=126358 RepID=A0ABD1QIQ4_9LAMI